MKAKTGNGISRPSAQHLHLPLVDRDSLAYVALLLSAGKENNMLAVPSSHWTITAGPKSSASMYSQESYMNSPPLFSESRVDRRRFGVAFSPSQEGPWRQVIQRAPNTPIIVLDTPRENAKEDDKVNIDGGSGNGEGEVVAEGVDDKKQARRKTTGTVGLKNMYTTAHSQASRSTKVFGKMLFRMSTHPPPTQLEATQEHPPPALPDLPPQILISLPSPGLSIHRDLPDLAETDIPLPKHPIFLVNSTPRNRSTLPSTWKPKRPPSPLPRPLRKKHGHTKHKRNASDTPFIPRSPLPPLPLLIIPASPVLSKSAEAIYPDAIGFSSSYFLHPGPSALPSQGTQDNPDMAESSIMMFLKARAMKTATYAIHDGGIISPP